MAIVYVLFYFKTINLNSVGIFIIIIFNWLALRACQHENYKWGIWHYLAAFWSLYFIVFTAYGIYNIIASSIEYGFVSNDVNTYLFFGSFFTSAILSQLILFWLKAINNKQLE